MIIETNKHYLLILETRETIKNNYCIINAIETYRKKTRDIDPYELLSSEDLQQYVTNSLEYYLFNLSLFNVNKFKQCLKDLRYSLNLLNNMYKTSFNWNTTSTAFIYCKNIIATLKATNDYNVKVNHVYKCLKNYYFMLGVFYKNYNQAKRLLPKSYKNII